MSLAASPRGVSDLFLNFDEATVKQDLNNSFSWTEQKHGCLEQTQNASIPNQIQKIKERLQWLQEQSIKDKQDYKEQLREARIHCREELQKKYRPLLQDSADSQANEGLVFEKTKIIQYLRDDNAKLRKEIEIYRRQIAQMTYDNKMLEQANKKLQEAIHELDLHLQGLDAVNQKLTSNCEIFKSHLKQMKDEYTRRHAYFHSEATMGMTYEVCLAKILSQVEGRSNDEALSQSVFAIAEEGAEEAAQGRDSNLQKAGLTTREWPRPPRHSSIFESSHDSENFAFSDDSDSEWDSDTE